MPIILKDRPESEHLWQILTVLRLGSSPSDLKKPELVRLTRIFGPSGLAFRLVFIGSENIDHLERELAT